MKKQTEGAPLVAVERDAAQLPAGRELDALVAERVMGERAASIVRDGDMAVIADVPMRALPRYSTDIAAAWQVVEKMVALGFKVRVEARRSGSYCDIIAPDSGVDSARENSIPLAICRAALLASGVSAEVQPPDATPAVPTAPPSTET